jgi:simple sugar transport system ATP-binding protein
MLDSTPTGLHSGQTPLLQTVGLTKRYGDFLANDTIDIEIWPRQIHALLGENGAGKSTLVKTIYGLIQPSEGEMRWQGEKMVLAGPSEARSRGIGMVFQHFSLFDNLTVAENVALGLDGKESFKDMSARLEQVSHVYGLPLDPKREVWQLSVGERQRIEIVRALMQNPKFLILDEPTAVLTPQEADQLFVVLERLKAEGRAVLYISHKLEEVKRLCDTATILRSGKKVSTCDPRAETAASLARMMVGADIMEVKAPAGRKTTVPRLVVNDLSLAPDDPHGVRLEHISLELKGGEILGIAGVAGNGQDELFAALSGERLSMDPGTVVIDGVAAGHLSITKRRRLGAAFVPEERLGHGTAPADAAFRERASDRTRRQRHGAARLRQYRGNPGDGRPRHCGVRRAQGQARPRSRQPVRRKPAEIRGRPRNPAQSRRARGQPADLGRRCRRRRRDPAGAARSRRQRRRSAGDQPGPRRTGRNRRPDRGDVPRPAVAADGDRGRQPREARPVDGRKQSGARGSGACSWCLKSAPSDRT